MTRPVGKRFEPGQSGNPGGKSKGMTEFTALMRENAPAAAEALIRGLDDPKAFKDCAALILAYAYGKPKQAVELSGEGGGAIGFEVIRRVIIDPARD